MPKDNLKGLAPVSGVEYIGVATVKEAIGALFD